MVGGARSSWLPVEHMRGGQCVARQTVPLGTVRCPSSRRLSLIEYCLCDVTDVVRDVGAPHYRATTPHGSCRTKHTTLTTPALAVIRGGKDDKKSSGKGGSRRERRKPVELRAGVNVCSVTSRESGGTFMERAAGTGRSPWRGDLVRGGTSSSSQPRASERETDTHITIGEYYHLL